MRFGRDGPALLKPEENGGIEPVDGESEETDEENVAMVIYDPLPPEVDIKRNKTVLN